MFAISRFAGVLALGVGIFGATLLPSAAGEYRGTGQNFIHHGMHGAGFGNHGFNHRRFDIRNSNRFDNFGHGMNVRNDHPRFGHHDSRFWQASNGDRFHPKHPRLQHLASGNFSTQRGSGITVQLSNRPDYDVISNDAGASDSFRTAAGTYSIGHTGYGWDRPAPTIMPRAKIIDIATMQDACSYENGVCVIRP